MELNNIDHWTVHSIVIEGKDDLIVYDTGLSREHGKLIPVESKKLSAKSIVAIIALR
jgi:hypothetical protein